MLVFCNGNCSHFKNQKIVTFKSQKLFFTNANITVFKYLYYNVILKPFQPFSKKLPSVLLKTVTVFRVL